MVGALRRETRCAEMGNVCGKKYPCPLPRTDSETRVYKAFAKHGRVSAKNLRLFYSVNFMPSFNKEFSFTSNIPFTMDEFVSNPIEQLYVWIEHCETGPRSCKLYIKELLRDIDTYASASEMYSKAK